MFIIYFPLECLKVKIYGGGESGLRFHSDAVFYLKKGSRKQKMSVGIHSNFKD